MYRDSLSTRILAAITILALAVFSVGFTWAAVDDYATRDVMPKGAAVDGVDIGGLPYAEALRTVEEKVEGPLLQPVTVDYAEKSFTVDPKQYVEIDVSGMLVEAAQPKVSSTLPERVIQKIAGSTVGHDVARKLKVDTGKLAAWAASAKQAVFVPAVDASVTQAGSSLKFTSAAPGRTLEETAAAAAVAEALMAGAKTVTLTTVTVPPKVTDAKLGKTILISRSKKTLTLYNGTKVEKTYRCAVGTPGYPTPLGWWKIVNKRYRPSWSNPGSAWAASMPDYIPPGPGNPLGTRALDLNASGIRIHGTNKDYSIGTAASHGCIRMHMWDVENLYPRVPLGTRVVIVR